MKSVRKLGAEWLLAMSSALFSVAPAASASPCGTAGTVEIANMTWASASIMANIHNIILQRGYRCNAVLVSGDTVTTVASAIARQRPQIVPELYYSNVKEAWDKGAQEGKVVTAGKVYSDGGIEGWWVPKYVVDAHPGLRGVADLPKFANLFTDPDDPSKGRVYSAPAGWATETVMKNQFKAFHLENSFNLYAPGSSAALDSAITRAYARKQPIVSYYWSPSAIVGKLDMVMLQMPPYDAAGHQCNQNPDCKTPYAGAYPRTELVTGMTTGLKQAAPDIAAYLQKVSMQRQTMNQLLAWEDGKGVDPKQAALHFLKTGRAIWSTWVSPDAAKRIDAYVSGLGADGS